MCRKFYFFDRRFIDRVAKLNFNQDEESEAMDFVKEWFPERYFAYNSKFLRISKIFLRRQRIKSKLNEQTRTFVKTYCSKSSKIEVPKLAVLWKTNKSLHIFQYCRGSILPWISAHRSLWRQAIEQGAFICQTGALASCKLSTLDKWTKFCAPVGNWTTAPINKILIKRFKSV